MPFSFGLFDLYSAMGGELANKTTPLAGSLN
jgi:hypothetical protein